MARIFYFNLLVIVASLIVPPVEPASADDKEAGAAPIAAKEAFAKPKTLQGAWDCGLETTHQFESFEVECRGIVASPPAGC